MSGICSTCEPVVRRTVYVPGSTRGPADAPAAAAAVGTRGGVSRIDQMTRLIPLRLPGGGVSMTRPRRVENLELHASKRVAASFR